MGLAVYYLADLPGFDTTIFAYRPEAGEKFQPLKTPGVPLVPLTFPNPIMPKKRSGPAFRLRQLQRLGAILRFDLEAIVRSLGKRPDIVHVHSPMHLLTALSAKMRGSVTCLTIHGSDFIRIAESRALRRSLKWFDIIFCMTHAHQRQLSEWFPDKKVIYLANGTNIEYFSDGALSASDRLKQVVGVGTLRWHKNFAVLLRAFAKLVQSDPDWRLTILGEGPEREMLARLADELGIAEYLSLPGAVSREQLRDTLQQSAIFVISSVTEGIPKALLEAMAAGCACITTDVGDCAEVLGVAGKIVPPKDLRRLTDALCELAGDPDARDRFGQAAALRSRNYSWSAYVQKHAEAYRDALARRRKGDPVSA
jgi:glycosyltransferase involved in cell wall biosynthesis